MKIFLTRCCSEQLLHCICIPDCLLSLSFLVGGSRLPFLVVYDTSLSGLENSPSEKSGLTKSSFSSDAFCCFVGHFRYIVRILKWIRGRNSRAA